jgi:dTDP-4-dehydrorhamnose reductase
MRVAITGASGRLGRALVQEFREIADVHAWSRPDYDLDDPDSAARVAGSHPNLVLHSAAWTDVDACARNPELAARRNGVAVAHLARACFAAACRLVVISTNEVFAGDRIGSPYRSQDPVQPINAYGASKLLGEAGAAEAFASQPDALLIARTAWLYGPPGNDFPTKIISAALSAREARTALRLVHDEAGSPSATADVAQGIRELIRVESQGVRHVVNAGQATRAEWATEILRAAGIDVPTELVPASTWRRDSTPPSWGVLVSDVTLRPWQEATREYIQSRVRLPERA